MECGGPFFPSGQPVASSGSNLEQGGNHSGNILAPINEERPVRRVGMREQDQYMPIANVIRIMRRILPAHAKISDDAKETVQDCVSEYISFITSEANDRCQKEQRKTVTAEDVLWAMGKLGFDDYVEPLTAFLNRYRDEDGDRSAPRGEPVLTRRGNANYAPAIGVGVPPVPLPPQPPQLSSYGPGFPVGPNLMGNMGGYYSGGGSSSGSSSNAPANFDPYAHLKRDGI